MRKKGPSTRRAGAKITQSGRPDLNRGPPAPKAGAIPGYATPRRTDANYYTRLALAQRGQTAREMRARDDSRAAFSAIAASPKVSAELGRRQSTDRTRIHPLPRGLSTIRPSISPEPTQFSVDPNAARHVRAAHGVACALTSRTPRASADNSFALFASSRSCPRDPPPRISLAPHARRATERIDAQSGIISERRHSAPSKEVPRLGQRVLLERVEATRCLLRPADTRSAPASSVDGVESEFA